MSEPSKEITVYAQGATPVVVQGGQAVSKDDPWLDVKKEVGKEAGLTALKLMAEGGSVWLKHADRQSQTEAEWQRIQGEMAKLDNETKNALQLLEVELAKSKEQTNKLDKILNIVATMSEEKARILAPMLEKMVEGAFLQPDNGPSA